MSHLALCQNETNNEPTGGGPPARKQASEGHRYFQVLGRRQRYSPQLLLQYAFDGGRLRRAGHRPCRPERLPIGQGATVQPAELLRNGPADARQPDRVRER